MRTDLRRVGVDRRGIAVRSSSVNVERNLMTFRFFCPRNERQAIIGFAKPDKIFWVIALSCSKPVFNVVQHFQTALCAASTSQPAAVSNNSDSNESSTHSQHDAIVCSV